VSRKPGTLFYPPAPSRKENAADCWFAPNVWWSYQRQPVPQTRGRRPSPDQLSKHQEGSKIGGGGGRNQKGHGGENFQKKSFRKRGGLRWTSKNWGLNRRKKNHLGRRKTAERTNLERAWSSLRVHPKNGLGIRKSKKGGVGRNK